jgi:hypothetical protein
MNKLHKIASKVVFSTISILLLAILVNQLDLNQIKSFLSVLINGKSLLLYVCLAIVSLFARSERFFIIHSISQKSTSLPLRLTILAGTALRNASMSVIPLRIGELSVPTLLRITNPKEKISKNLNPVWISILFDMSALFILGLTLFIAMKFYTNTSLNNSNLKIGFIENIMIISISFCLIFSLLNFTKIISKTLNSIFLKKINIKVFKYHFSPSKISKNIPILTFSLTLRILLLSIIIRISKYLSLTNLFFALSESIEPNLDNIFPIFIAFVSSEIFSSLPGSGVMGFGGYELTFQWILKLLLPLVACTLTTITTIHLIGFIVEIAIACTVIPTCLILSKTINNKIK